MLKRIGTVIALPWPGWQTTGGRGIFHDYRGPWKRTSPSQRSRDARGYLRDGQPRHRTDEAL